MAVMDRFASGASRELDIVDQYRRAVDATIPVGGYNLLGENYAAYMGSGDQQKLTDSPPFLLRFLKSCLQKWSQSVFGSLNAFSRPSS